MTKIAVYSPRFWWRAPAENIRDWVPYDPDGSGKAPRWPNISDHNWPAITQAVVSVSRALAAGRWRALDDEDEDDWGEVTIVSEPLNTEERGIVDAWFGNAEPVQVDPWLPWINNGRHRLWHTLDHFGTELVPICGMALEYANEADISYLGSDWSSSFAEDLTKLQEIRWFDGTDGLNRRFLDSMTTAAHGGIPEPA